MEDSVDCFARTLGLESEAIAFLREYPAALQNAIIAGFDASGSKDGNVLGRLQSYSRHLAKRTASNTAAMATPSSKGKAGYVGSGMAKETRMYSRELLLIHWEQSDAAIHDGDAQMLKAIAVPQTRTSSKMSVDGPTTKPDRRTPSPEVVTAPPVVQLSKAPSGPPDEAPPPPPPPLLPPQVDAGPSDLDPVVSLPPPSRSQEPVAMAERSKLIRPAALDAALEQTPSRKARPGLNADAPEFVPGMPAPFSPAAHALTPTPTPKQPRTPLSLAATIAGPEEPPSPPPRSPLLRGLPPVFGIPPMSPAASPWAPPPPVTEPNGTAAAINAADDDSQVPPPLQRSVTVPAGHVAAFAPAQSKSTFEYHLHRLLYMLVARRCNDSEASSEQQGLLLNSVRSEWAKVYGSDMEALMDKCGHKEVEPLIRQIDGLQIVGVAPDLRAVTASTDAKATAPVPPAPAPLPATAPAAATAPPTPTAARPAVGPAPGALGATVASSEAPTTTAVPSVIGAGRRKPPPPPPAAPPALLGGGLLGLNSAVVGSGTPKVLSLDQHVESPCGKALGLEKYLESPSGQPLSDPLSQWGALNFGNSPGMLWNPQGWPSGSPTNAATLWYPGCPAPPDGPPGPALRVEADVGPPPAHDAPTLEPLSSSAF